MGSGLIFWWVVGGGDGSGWWWMVADGCGWWWIVVDGGGWWHSLACPIIISNKHFVILRSVFSVNNYESHYV